MRVTWTIVSYEKKKGAISLKLLGGELAPKLVYFVLRKELLKALVKWHQGVEMHE